MTAAEIVYRCLQQLKGNNISDDNSISEDLIYNMLVSYRAKLIRQERSAGKWISSMYVQDLGEIELAFANKHDDCAVNREDCPILKSVSPIPKAVDTALNDMITFVGTLEGMPFEKTTAGSARYMIHSKYTGSKPKYYFVGDHIYVVNPKTNLLKFISISGVFEDPKAANSFKKCGNASDCYEDLNFEFPISASLVDTIIKMMVEEIRGSKIAPTDAINNSKDDNN